MCTYYCSAASVGLNPTEEKVAEMIARLGHCHIPAGRFYEVGRSRGQPSACWTLPLPVASPQFEADYGFPAPVELGADAARQIAEDHHRELVPVVEIWEGPGGDPWQFRRRGMFPAFLNEDIDAGKARPVEKAGDYRVVVLRDGTRWLNQGATPHDWGWQQVK